MKFNDIKYERIDYEKIKNKIEDLLIKLENANKDDFLIYFKKINKIQNHIEEMYDYADINNMRNQDDEFYLNEINYWNEYKSKFDLLFNKFYEIILKSKYKEELKKHVPNNFFRIIENMNKIDISDLVKLENELKLKYRNLNRNKISFDNQELTISKLSSYFKNKDRNIRKQAHDCLNDYYYKHQNEYDIILFELIKIRNEIAKKLGFNNYKEYSLVKLKRFGYDYNDINKFRNNIIKYINPLIKEFRKKQKKELGIKNLKYYDTVFFKDMPNINIYGNELIKNIINSFKKIDTDFYNFANDMFDNNYIDLENRENKVNFSITNYLVETKQPVITGNFKNNYLDVITFTHEIGHAYQKHCASLKDNEFISPLLKYPTMEIAEMFSYAMELINLNYVNVFNQEDNKKYKFMEIHKLISNLPYICLVDEFQEIIYSIKDLKVEDIRNTWIKLAKKYDLKINNSGHINLDEGGYFYRQSHIYLDPFYYIDYGLSYFGALAIANECKNNLNLFKELASVASYYSFDELIKKYNLPNPFIEDTIKNIVDEIMVNCVKLV